MVARVHLLWALEETTWLAKSRRSFELQRSPLPQTLPGNDKQSASGLTTGKASCHQLGEPRIRDFRESLLPEFTADASFSYWDNFFFLQPVQQLLPNFVLYNVLLHFSRPTTSYLGDISPIVTSHAKRCLDFASIHGFLAAHQ